MRLIRLSILTAAENIGINDKNALTSVVLVSA